MYVNKCIIQRFKNGVTVHCEIRRTRGYATRALKLRVTPGASDANMHAKIELRCYYDMNQLIVIHYLTAKFRIG